MRATSFLCSTSVLSNTTILSPSPLGDGNRLSSSVHLSPAGMGHEFVRFGAVDADQTTSGLSLRRSKQLSRINGPAWRYISRSTPASEPNTKQLRPPFPVPPRSSPLAVRPTAPPDNEDPLEALLRENKSDGPMIAATLTSLHRSCLYNSDITETIAMSVRLCFHKLIRMKAVQAAVNFYWRLMELGVSLRSADIALLFSNLPYDKEVRDDDLFQRRPKSWLEKKREEEMRKKEESRASRSTTVTLPQEPQIRVALEDETLQNGVTSDADDLTSRVRSLHRKRMMERWRVYEAAMGHIDYHTGMPTATASETAEGSDASELHRATAAVNDDYAAQCEVAMLIHHLCFLQQGGDASKQGVSAASRGCWAEALHLTSRYIQTTLTKRKGCPIALPDGVALATCKAIELAPSNASWRPFHSFQVLCRCNSRIEREVAILIAMRMCDALKNVHRSRKAALLLQAIRDVSVPRLVGANQGERGRTSMFALQCISAVQQVSHLSASPEKIPDLLGTSVASLREAITELQVMCEASRRQRGRVADEEAKSDNDKSQGMPNYFDPSSFEDGVTRRRTLDNHAETEFKLVCHASNAVIPVVPLLHRLSRNVSRHRWQSSDSASTFDALIVTTIIDGLFKAWSVMFDRKRATSATEIRMMMNSPERGVTSMLVVLSSLRWISLGSTRSKRSSKAPPHISPNVVSTLLAGAVECLRMAKATDKSDSARRQIGKAVNRVVVMHELTTSNVPFTMSPSTVEIEILASVLRMVCLTASNRKHVFAMRLSRNVLRQLIAFSSSASLPGKRARMLLSSGDLRAIDALRESLQHPGRERPQMKKTTRKLTRQTAKSSTQSSMHMIIRAQALSRAEKEGVLSKQSVTNLCAKLVAETSDSREVLNKRLMELLLSSKSNPELLPVDDWHRALLVMDAVCRNLALRPDLIDLATFKQAFENLSRNEMTSVESRKQPTQRRASTWMQAASLFRFAVKSSCPATSASKSDEVATLQAMDVAIAPLLRVALANGNVQVARRWNDRWMRMHQQSSPTTWEGEQMLVQRLTHATILKDRDALSRILHFRSRAGVSSGFLQATSSLLHDATRNEAFFGRWDHALRLLCQSQSGATDHSLLLALQGCPRSQFRTAHKLFHSKKSSSQWSHEDTVLVIKMALKGRMWKDALAVFADADVFASNMTSPAALLQGLRACAVGGKSAEAETLYDTLRGLLAGPPSGAPRRGTPHDAAIECSLNRILDVLDEDSTPSRDAVTVSDDKEPLHFGRMLFLRAMTKGISRSEGSKKQFEANSAVEAAS